MTSGFSSNELLKSLSTYPVIKGDLPGHEFHGNQYEAGVSGSAKAVTTRGEKMFHTDANGPARNTWGGNTTKDFADMVSAHQQLATDHDNASKRIEAGMKSGKIPMSKWGVARKAIEAHQTAAEAHLDASKMWQKSNELGYSGREQGVPTTAFGAYTMSEKAGRLTDQAEALSKF